MSENPDTPAQRAAQLMKCGPYAFPFNMQDGKGGEFGCPGMTLREWFAGHIMASAMANAEGVQDVPDDLLVRAAGQAYRVADALLKARSAPINDGEK